MKREVKGDFIKRNAVLSSTVTNGSLSESITKRSKKAKTFKKDPAYINYKLGKTINTGNYESIRIDVSFTVPCDPSKIKKTLKVIQKDVEEELEIAAKRITNPEPINL